MLDTCKLLLGTLHSFHFLHCQKADKIDMSSRHMLLTCEAVTGLQHHVTASSQQCLSWHLLTTVNFWFVLRAFRQRDIWQVLDPLP